MSPGRTSLPQFTDRLRVGDTLEVSPFCLGAVRTSDTVLAAYDAGINFFFLSGDLHWPVYQASRDGLAALFARGGGIRDHVVVAVAAYVTQPVFCQGPFLEVLRFLPGLERFDLMVAGGAYRDELPRRLGALREVRRRTYAHASLGVSFHDRGAAVATINEGAIDVAFIRYNPLHPGARADLLPQVRRDRTRIYNFTSTHGFREPEAYALPEEAWRPEIGDYYRFALTRPEIDGLLIGPQSAGELEALAAALEAGPLDADEEEHLLTLAEIVKGAPG